MTTLFSESCLFCLLLSLSCSYKRNNAYDRNVKCVVPCSITRSIVARWILDMWFILCSIPARFLAWFSARVAVPYPVQFSIQYVCTAMLQTRTITLKNVNNYNTASTNGSQLVRACAWSAACIAAWNDYLNNAGQLLERHSNDTNWLLKQPLEWLLQPLIERHSNRRTTLGRLLNRTLILAVNINNYLAGLIKQDGNRSYLMEWWNGDLSPTHRDGYKSIPCNATAVNSSLELCYGWLPLPNVCTATIQTLTIALNPHHSIVI
jgi:hypothetical protein